MFKYIRAVARMFFYIIWAYFAWMVPYSRHPERYPLSLRYARARAIAIRATKALNIDLIVENPDILKKDGTYFFVSNHYSMYDGLIMVVLSEKPLLFVVKNEIRKQPFFGRIMRTLGCVFIERDNLKQEVVALKKVKESLNKNECSWVIYPEGTRNRDLLAPLLPFKAGTFKMALDTKTTIIPVATFGNFRPLGMKFHFKR
jgi:1-acyl-sn-glycerol-3-phosphate acyltransferase